jgi:hypothetical protein
VIAYVGQTRSRALIARLAALGLGELDGMTEADVIPELRWYQGVFVGGSLAWKLATGGAWTKLARRRGLRCHIGRVGTAARVHWARSVGATSIEYPELWILDVISRTRLSGVFSKVSSYSPDPSIPASGWAPDKNVAPIRQRACAQADHMVPELGVEVTHGADGSTDVETSARGVPAVLALAAVLIVLIVVAGFVAMPL